MNNNIENWENLTEEQKKYANSQLGQINNIKIEEHPASVFFNTFGWVKIENFINKETAKLLYTHVLTAAKRLSFLEQVYGEGKVDKSIWGINNNEKREIVIKLVKINISEWLFPIVLNI